MAGHYVEHFILKSWILNPRGALLSGKRKAAPAGASTPGRGLTGREPPAMTDDRTPARLAPQADAPSPDKLKTIKLLYGKSLDDDDVAAVAALETEYARWPVWPHLRFSYPANQVYYPRRANPHLQFTP